MATKLFDSTIVGTAEQALDFIGNILVCCLISSLHNSDVIPAERAGARESRNPGNTRISRFPLARE